MSIVLNVKPDVLKRKANSISTSINNIEKELNEIGTVILGSRKYWEGDASDAHQKYYKVFEEDIPTITGRLKEHPKELLAMAEIYDTTEKANQQLANKLPDNMIV